MLDHKILIAIGLLLDGAIFPMKHMSDADWRESEVLQCHKKDCWDCWACVGLKEQGRDVLGMAGPIQGAVCGYGAAGQCDAGRKPAGQEHLLKALAVAK